VFLFLTLNWNVSYCLRFKQDKLQFTTKNYILLSLCVSWVTSGSSGTGGCRRRRWSNLGRSCFTAGLHS